MQRVLLYRFFGIEMKERISRKDIVLISVLLITGLVLFVAANVFGGSPGKQVKISVDGKEYGIYNLQSATEQVISIKQDGKVTNILRIHHGQADMIEADCPDGLCVKQKNIANQGATIVCLPNKVVVEVLSEEEPAYDSMVR